MKPLRRWRKSQDARARSEDDYDPRGRPTVYGGASNLDLVPEADLDATADVPLEELEGVPPGWHSSSVDATPATPDRYAPSGGSSRR